MKMLDLSAEQLKAALNECTLVSVTDRRGFIVDVNEKFCEVSGFTRAELIGNTHRLVHSGAHHQIFFQSLWNTIHGGETWRGDICNRHKNGKTLWLETTIVPILNSEKAPYQFVSLSKDITQTKILADMDRNIIENAGSCIIATDLHGVITSFNPGAEHLLGYKADEVIGIMSPAKFHDEKEIEARAKVLTNELGHHVSADFEAFSAKTMATQWPDENDWTYVCKDGQRKIVRLCVTTIVSSAGRSEGFLGIASDITELRKSIAEREEYSSRLTKIASQVPGMVFQFLLRPDGSRCFPYASEHIREIYRMNPDDVLLDASPIDKVIHPEDLHQFKDSIRQSAQTLQAWTCEYRTQFLDGVSRWLWGSATPERTSDGSVQWYGVIMDITARKEAEVQLREASLHDPLTGLHNRLFAESEIKRMQGGRRYPLAVIVLDLDGLKLTNDVYGHSEGDRLLQLAAETLRKCFRPEDLVARMGGDEFLVILPGSNEEAMRAAIKRLRAIVDLTPPLRNDIPLSLSVGGSCAGDANGFQQAMMEADSRMYDDKSMRKAARS